MGHLTKLVSSLSQYMTIFTGDPSMHQNIPFGNLQNEKRKKKD